MPGSMNVKVWIVSDGKYGDRAFEEIAGNFQPKWMGGFQQVNRTGTHAEEPGKDLS